jgi:septum formation protein
MIKQVELVLASQSVGRLDMLKQMGLKPDHITPADIDEAEGKNELPRDLVQRLALQKLQKIIPRFENAVIIAADSVVAVGRRILPKAEDDDTVAACLKLMSGRRHRVYTSVAVARNENGQTVKLIQKTALSLVKFKCLTMDEIAAYVSTREGVGKAGGYTAQGKAAAFMPWMSGSVSNIIGLPLFETRNILLAMGLEV